MVNNMKKLIYIDGTKEDGYTVMVLPRFNGDINVSEKTIKKLLKNKKYNVKLTKYDINIKGSIYSNDIIIHYALLKEETKFKDLKELITYSLKDIGD